MSRRDAEAALAAIERIGARLVCWGEPLYPAALAAVEDAPPVLTMLGRPEMILAPMVAVVGARNASAIGRRLARELAAGLGESGIVVVSGLAVYPEENRGLYDALARDGAILAELPLGTEPQARHFPRRNRIISGVALGVVVVEAAAKSGSLITARFALEQGREVFAVPGSPLDPRSRGTNDLLRSGATLTETAADVVAQLGPLLQGRPPAHEIAREMAPGQPRLRLREAPPRMELPAPSLPVGEDDAIEMIVEKLSPTPVAVDELVRQCQLSAAAVAMLLLDLELAGRVERHPGNLVSLR